MPLFGPPSIDKLRDRKDVAALRKAMYDEKYTHDQHLEAARALAYVEGPAAIPSLLQLYNAMQGKYFSLRHEVLVILLNQEEPGIQALVQAAMQGTPGILEDLVDICVAPKTYSWTDWILKPAWAAIRGIGPQAYEHLWEKIRTEAGRHLIGEFIKLLGENYSPQSFDLLMRLLTGGERYDRQRAAFALLPWYSAGLLDEAQKTALLQQREYISREHVDKSNQHTDNGKHGQHTDLTDNCVPPGHYDSPAQDHTDTTAHIDEGGLEITFPL
jgi:hypothetical protein